MKQKKRRMRIVLTALISLCIAACGKPEDKGRETEMEYETEDAVETDNGKEEEENTDRAVDGAVNETAKDKNANIVTTAYLTEDIEYRDEVIPVQYVDDLSLLEDMKYTDSTYAYQDGKVYYRRYHEDSYEEAALWGIYDPVSETEKEIVCIDSDGVETELFADKGYGDIYLIHNRFYMTDGRYHEENGTAVVEEQLYSVDMQGKDRIDYGNGSIVAVDKERKKIILQIREQDGICFCALDYETGKMKQILSEPYADSICIRAYQDGRIYYVRRPTPDAAFTRLCAVSLEGEQRDIIELISDINQKPYMYDPESILEVEVDANRIYFVFGGYDGHEHVFQGGKLVSVKLDGTDYKAVETTEDFFYLCHDGEKALVYFIDDQSLFVKDVDTRKKYYAQVWDVDADICYLSEFPQKILYSSYSQMRSMWPYYPAVKSFLFRLYDYDSESGESQTYICAMPDDSGKITRVVMELEDTIPEEKKEEWGEIQDLYYADGFLYFTVECNVYDEETSIGWRDGYRRMYSDVYRLKVGEHVAQMLYTY